MKNLNVSQPLSRETRPSHFEAAKALASSPLLSGPELIAWHDYGVSHDRRLEVDVGGEASFIFMESSPFDSYSYFGHGPFTYIRDARDNEMICRIGGVACVPLDNRTSKLT